MRSFRYSVKWFWLPLRLALGVTKPRRRILGSYFSGVIAKCGANVTGFSPGDEDNYSQPYYYVTPWPPPKLDDPNEVVGGGRWHTKDWVGAVLPASAVVEEESGESQASLVGDFLEGAVNRAASLLDRG